MRIFVPKYVKMALMKRIYSLCPVLFLIATMLFRPYSVQAQSCCPEKSPLGVLGHYEYDKDNVKIEVKRDPVENNGGDGDWCTILNVATNQYKVEHDYFIMITASSSRNENSMDKCQLGFWLGPSASGKTQNYAGTTGPKQGIYTITIPSLYQFYETDGWSYENCYYYWSWRDGIAPTAPAVVGYSTFSGSTMCNWLEWVCPFGSWAHKRGESSSNYQNLNSFKVSVEPGDGGKMFVKVYRDEDCAPALTIGTKTDPDVNKVTTTVVGNGTVTMSPACEYHTKGETVTLTPTPANKNTCFKGWTGTDASIVTDNGNGTYSLTMPAKEVSLTANFGPCIIEATETVTLCATELPYTWHGTTYSAPGSYTNDYTCPSLKDALTDSITHLVLTINPTYNKTDGATICDTELPYTWQGETFTAAGSRTKTLKTVAGCDSTVTFTLNVNKTYNKTDGATICDTELPYTWQGETFTAAGSKTKTLKTVAGCDSTVTFTLNVNQTYNNTDGTTVCETELPYQWQDVTFKKADFTSTDSKAVTRTLKTVAGCDSVVTFTLNVIKTIHNSVARTVCDKALPYKWDGLTFGGEGMQTRKLKSLVTGCDSVVDYHLSVSTGYMALDGATICTGDLPYTWEGYTFTQAGTKTQTLRSVSTGCDSIVTFTLEVRTSPETTVKDIFCEGDTYTFGDTLITTAGTYIKRFAREGKCDSIVTLELTALSAPVTVAEEATITEGESYTWAGHGSRFAGLTADSTYRDTLQHTIGGCDSVYYVLRLHIASPNLRMTVTADTACAGDPAFTLRLLALEGKPQTCNILFDATAHQQKFADTLSVKLTAGGAENVVAVDMPLNTADTTDYVRPGNYNFTVRVSAAGGKTEEYPCTLTVLYPSWVLFQRWNDVLAVSNEDYNGHYTFSAIRWYHAGKLLEGKGDKGAYIYQDLVYGDPYWAELTRTDDGQTIRTCTFYPEKLVDGTNAQALHVRLLPRRESRQVGVETDAEGQYMVYDMAGRTVLTGEFGTGMQDIIFRPSDADGTYLLFFRANDGRTASRKWIVR